MTADPIAVSPSEDVETAWSLMGEHRVRHVPVVDAGGHLLGLLSQRDVLAAGGPLSGSPPPLEAVERTLVADVMTRSVESVGPEDDIRGAAGLMFERKYGCLPVLENRRLVGVLTEADFVRLLAGGN
jgi:CBS domain-containing protein